MNGEPDAVPVPATAALPAESQARPRTRLDDRLNPILIKEVRQSLRGRYFKILFWFTLVAATLTGVALVASAVADGRTEQMGGEFFFAMWFILAVAVHAFVPFSAFVSTGAEWEENTYDLLVLSNLRPRQLVLGKLLSAVIQAVLFYSAFAPFMVFAFLMNGVDLLVVLILLGGSMLLCAGLSLLAIALSSLARPKFVRVLMMALLSAGLVFVTSGSIAFGYLLTDEPEFVRNSDFLPVFTSLLTVIATVGLFSFAVACSRMAHAEENTSSGLRVMTLVLGLVGVLWGGWMMRETGSQEMVLVGALVVALVMFLPLLFLVTEPESLGRRTRAHVPRNPLLATLAIPFLPGGGRGVLLLGLYALVVFGCAVLVFLSPTFNLASKDYDNELAVIAAGLAYLWAYLACPSGLAAIWFKTFRERSIARISILLLALLAFFLPALLGLFLDVKDWMEFEHPFNPFYTIIQLERGRASRLVTALILLALYSVVGLVVNVPRISRGVREVLAASRERRLREAPSAPDAGSTPDALPEPEAVPEPDAVPEP